MGGSPAPTPNPMMDEMARLMMNWGKEDRARYESVFQPLENKFVADAAGYDTPERRAAEAQKAAATVGTQAATARGIQDRQMQAMGVNPASGRYADSAGRSGMAEGLARVGAQNMAEKQVMDEGQNRMLRAIGLGQGLATNPGTSMALGSDMMNAQYNNQMNAWSANQNSMSSLMGGLGSLAGAGMSTFGPTMMPMMFSSKKLKTDKVPARGALRAVENMPVEEWTYKKGVADGKRHIGTYAEDFKRETGKGDGKSIPIVDAIGVTMGAVKELSAKVDNLARGAMQAAA